MTSRITLLLFGLLFWSCTKDVGKLPAKKEAHRYPDAVASILLNKCATAGCHNAVSKEAAGGLNLETWNTLFHGSRGGASVIPYRPDFSTLLYYTNSFTEYGTIQLAPKMPYNMPPLNKDEIKTLFDWISTGAPNASGDVAFASFPRKKLYVGNQGCDVVTVLDAESMLAMRYIGVGETRGIEAPHMVRVSPDNQHWYVSFIAGGYFQKYQVSNDSLVAKVNLGVGSWNTFVISPDSRTAYVVDWSLPGKIAVVDLASMTAVTHLPFNNPHGSALLADKTLYVTAQTGNYIYKFDLPDFSSPTIVILDESGIAINAPSLDPHEIIFAPDGSKYFVTCQVTNEVRVLNTTNDSLIAVIPVGGFPQEMALSVNKPYLFVSCMDDTTANPLQLSSISVINYQELKHVKKIYAGYQSHGLAVDDDHNRVFVSNRNIFTTGPQPHHQGLCTGRNGYLTAIDLISLSLIPGFKCEVSVDPYGIGISP